MLTDAQCRTATPREKPYKLSDQHGLYLEVRPSGARIWKQKYRVGQREKKLTHGPYPEVKLTEARERMWAARALLRDGLDPARKPHEPECARTFGEAARKWLSLQQEGWKPKHYSTVAGRIEADLLPRLADEPLDAVKPSLLVEILSEVQERGALEVAHRLRGYCSNIFECAIALDWTELNPAASIGKALKPKRSRHYPAIVRIGEARAFLRLVEAQPCQPSTKLASRLLALTAVRPGTLRFAQRDEFVGLDGEEPYWHIPANKMKLDLDESEQELFDFIVPLPRQAVEVLKVAISFSGRRKYLFPSTRYSHRPISENALSTNYRRVPLNRGSHVPHGWRSTFSTIMNERAADLERPGDRAIIDLMLAHKPRGTEATYNRAAYMPRRRLIAQEWADLLCEGLVAPESLVEGPRKT